LDSHKPKLDETEDLTAVNVKFTLYGCDGMWYRRSVPAFRQHI